MRFVRRALSRTISRPRFAIAICVLVNEQRVLPRWFGYFNAWVGTGYALAAMEPQTESPAPAQ